MHDKILGHSEPGLPPRGLWHCKNCHGASCCSSFSSMIPAAVPGALWGCELAPSLARGDHSHECAVLGPDLASSHERPLEPAAAHPPNKTDGQTEDPTLHLLGKPGRSDFVQLAQCRKRMRSSSPDLVTVMLPGPMSRIRKAVDATAMQARE